MNVGRSSRPTSGWAARILGLLGQDAGVPGRRRGRDRRAAPARRASAGRADALAAPAPGRRRSATGGDHPAGRTTSRRWRPRASAPRWARPASAMLGARGASAETTRVLQPGPRRSWSRRRRSWPSASWRSSGRRSRSTRRRPRRRAGTRRPRPRRSRSSRRPRRRRRPRRSRRRASRRWPALLGPKAEADVDAAADELLRAAGLTPAGKARLRDGRTGAAVRGRGHGRLDLHAEAEPPGGRQDPRALASDRTRW